MEKRPVYYRVLSGIGNETKKGEAVERLSQIRYFAESESTT